MERDIMNSMMESVVEFARSAGELTMRHWRSGLACEGKAGNAKDHVTAADRAVEAFLVAEIHKRFPSHGVLGEEGGLQGASSPEYLWVIDPIDGTTSFARGQRLFSVSIGLKYRGETIAGAVNAPAIGELYAAERGGGAWRNGTERLHVSAARNLGEAVVSTGFACLRANLPENNIPILGRVLPLVVDMRRTGTAAFDLCQVAAGHTDAYWEFALHDYDVAAGALIVTEAGGVVTDFNGNADYPKSGIVAAAPRIHPSLLKLIKP